MNHTLRRIARYQAPHSSVDGDRLADGIDQLIRAEAPRLRTLFAYYRNTTRITANSAPTSDRPYRQAQEWGLPARITGEAAGREPFAPARPAGQAVTRKAIVIENDIGWRIDAQVDYLFGKPIVLGSAAPDPARRPVIEALLRQVIARHGGLVFLQQLALLGAVYGSVDVLVKYNPRHADQPDARPVCETQSLGASAPGLTPGPAVAAPSVSKAPLKNTAPASASASPDNALPAAESARDSAPARPASDAPVSPADASSFDDFSAPSSAASHPSPGDIDRLARMIRLEIVEPTRALSLLREDDCTCVEAFAIVYPVARADRRPTRASASTASADATDPSPRWLGRLMNNLLVGPSLLKPAGDATVLRVDLQTTDAWQRYEDGKLLDEGHNTLGRLPLVHIQNTPSPLEHAGRSDVEPLLPLQDELNTRLCDRAHRIALQSAKMYLGKNIDNFTDLPIAPGQMWSTPNVDAGVVEFGGDAACPSETQHIADCREALDKQSGVSPAAAGAIKGRVGNLTSAAALRVTMSALLSRTERKRTTYGQALGQICELALAWLDHAGQFRTLPNERQIILHWPSPIPVNEIERLQEAQLKQRIGVPQQIILNELGYGG